jgi:hypothetical protein
MITQIYFESHNRVKQNLSVIVATTWEAAIKMDSKTPELGRERSGKRSGFE